MLAFWDKLLRGKSVSLQNSTPSEGTDSPINPLIGPYIPAYNSGARNSYVSYGAMVRELDRRWNGIATYGSHLIQTLIEYRQNWIAGNGCNYDSGSARNMEVLQEVIDYNDLDSKFFRELVAEAEIEGKLLLRLIPMLKNGKPVIRVIHIPWVQSNYNVVCEPYSDEVSRVEIPQGAGEKPIILQASEVVYVRFGGSRRYLNTPAPRLGTVLWNTEVVDRAVNDLRDINHKFGAAFPAWKMPDQASAFAKANEIIKNNWEIGHYDVSVGDLKYVEPSGTGAQQLKDEIVRHMQIISARSGVPIHFLGYVELMSNRATAAELLEMVSATTAGPRDTFAEMFEYVGQKSLMMYSALTGEVLDYEDVECTIPQVTMAQIEQLVNVYMPLAQAGFLSNQSVMERIPGIDVDEERKRMDDETQQNNDAAIMAYQSRRSALQPQEGALDAA